jgi:threonine/homoserine/homoserine lactone efflux protein
MHNLALFATAFIVGLSGAMLPGPFLTTAIAETMRRGFWTGPLMVLGHAILELALVLALVAGLATYLVRREVTMAIALLGGAFLIFLGLSMSRDSRGSRISLDMLQASAASSVRLHPVLAGLTVSFANPLWHLWWATVGLGYITLAMQSGTAGMAAFFSGHISSDLAWYSLVSLAVSGGRRFMNQSVYDLVLLVCGLFLLGLGGYFVYWGLQQ